MNDRVKQIIERFTETAAWKKFRRNDCLYKFYKKIAGNKVEHFVLSDRVSDVQNNGLKAISEITDVLSGNDVDFFVDNGTLLGVVRENKLIRWDYDIDLGIIINEKFSWLDLENAMKRIGYEKDHQFRLFDEITEQTYKRGGMYVDFFNHINDDSTTSFYCFYRDDKVEYSSSNEMSVLELKTVKITGTKQIDLEDGVKVYIPLEAEQYLAGLYGESWRIPNPNWVSGSGPACIHREDCFGYYEKNNSVQ